MLISEIGAAERYDALYLSPHLDDVALSCVARIGRDLSQGWRVLVATVFSEGDGYEARRAEDARAMEALGADHLWCGLRDAPFRSPAYGTFMGIVFGTDESDDSALEATGEVLAALIARTAPRIVLAPLAVGTHVDHRLVHKAARRLRAEVRFYEDRPYALVPGLAALRLAELGKSSSAGLPDQAAFLAGLQAAPYVKAFLGAGERVAALQRYRAQWTRAASGDGMHTASVEAVAWSADARARAAAALPAYASQMASVGGTLEQYLDACAATPERYWRLS